MKPTACLTIIRTTALVLVSARVLFTSEALASNITIDTVPVGNVGNGADTTGFGAVSYAYSIGTTEVTNAQYAAFLNAKASNDPLRLYSSKMGSITFGGITRSGSSGSYTYAPMSGRENRPVGYVTWYNAIRFANWLHNGQGNGDTETGAYTILGGTATPSNGSSIVRNSNARWFLPSEDEWYKAAYHKNDGETSNYFEYPTSSDTPPTAEAPAGGSNSANYDNVVGIHTDVGVYIHSVGPYGTYDQAGNVAEWNDSLTSDSNRVLRGGSFTDGSYRLSKEFSASSGASLVRGTNGFRVATVPEPSSLVLAAMGAVLAAMLTCARTQPFPPGK